MALFNFRNKKNASCVYEADCNAETIKKAASAQKEGANVKILGSGCAKCNQLEAATRAALEQLGMDTEIDHVTDFTQIAAYGVMSTPALMVDGKVIAYGRVLKTEEVVKLLQKTE